MSRQHALAALLGMNFEFHRFLFGAVPGFRARFAIRFRSRTCAARDAGSIRRPRTRATTSRFPRVRRACGVTQMFKSMSPTRQETFGLPTTAGSAGSDFFDSIRRRRKRIDA
jgi:hypothetical protein